MSVLGRGRVYVYKAQPVTHRVIVPEPTVPENGEIRQSSAPEGSVRTRVEDEAVNEDEGAFEPPRKRGKFTKATKAKKSQDPRVWMERPNKVVRLTFEDAAGEPIALKIGTDDNVQPQEFSNYLKVMSTKANDTIARALMAGWVRIMYGDDDSAWVIGTMYAIGE
jgi:hypothetical protein